jgi:hypothetical protein
MNTRITIQDELKELGSHLPPNVSFPGLDVPLGYFDGLSQAILARIKNSDTVSVDQELTELSPLLASIPKTSVFSIPEGYFMRNLENIDVVVAEESSAIINSAGKDMPYVVPSGYFESFSTSVLRKVRPQAKVVAMNPGRWMRVAAAAIIAGIITISGIVYFSGKQEIKVDNPQWVAKKLQNVSDRELDEFVKTSDVNQGTIATVKKKAVKTSEVNRLLKDVPDNELDAFLEQMPSEDLEASLN